MQTVGEYKEYTKQLEGEVGKWHHAYDALMVERNQLAGKYAEVNLRVAAMAQRIAELETELEHRSVELQIARASHRNTLTQLKDFIVQYNKEKENKNAEEKQ